jgi:hypothetical protein
MFTREKSGREEMDADGQDDADAFGPFRRVESKRVAV